MKLYCSLSHTASWNLAAEEHLFNRSENCLFLYRNDSSVVLGCHQAWRRELAIDYCKQHHVAIVRRISGGGAVYHDLGNLNFCFVMPKRPNVSPLENNCLHRLVDLLKGMDIGVYQGKRNDLWINDKKITGTASHIGRQAILFHGTLLYDANLSRLHAALGLSFDDSNNPRQHSTEKAFVPSVPSPVTNLRDQTGMTLSSEDFFATFVAHCVDYFQLEEACFDEHDRWLIDKLKNEKYDRDEWIYRK